MRNTNEVQQIINSEIREMVLGSYNILVGPEAPGRKLIFNRTLASTLGVIYLMTPIPALANMRGRELKIVEVLLQLDPHAVCAVQDFMNGRYVYFAIWLGMAHCRAHPEDKDNVLKVIASLGASMNPI
jgi:hypothetical protein